METKFLQRKHREEALLREKKIKICDGALDDLAFAVTQKLDEAKGF